jgi:hypothetical protein
VTPGGCAVRRQPGEPHTAPALISLAETEAEPEASRLREEARRLFRLLGGVPTWLARHLTPTPPTAEAATA